MKEGWEYKTLGECCEILNGYPFKSSLYSNSGIRVIRITNVQKGYVIDSNPKYYPESKINEISNFILKNEDILISLTGNVGRVAILQKEFLPAALNQRVACLRIKDMIVNKKFLFFYLNNDLFEKLCIKNSTGAAQLNMSTVWLKKQIIPIPSYDEQRRIVSYLDTSFKLIDEIKNKALKSLTEAKALFQSALAETMEPKEGWEEKTLGEIAEIKGGKRVPKGYKLLTEPTNHKYIRVADFNDFGSITLENIQYISDEVYNQIKRYTISSKDVYISIAGTIGKSGIIPKELEGANLTENACKLVLDSCAYKYFVYYFTKSTLFLNQIKKLTMISAQPKLALTRLATVNIPLPTLPTQKSIVSHLDKLSSKVRAIEEKYQKMVEECDALKQAMLRDVFE